MSAFSTIQRTLILPAVLFLAVLGSQCSLLNPAALADEYGSFNESGQYQYYGTGPGFHSLKPSIGQPGYESLRQQEERADMQRNQDQLRGYHNTPQEPTWVEKHPGPTHVYPGDGSMRTCYPSFNNSVVCQ